MLREQPVINALLINIFFGAAWHYISFFLCISINTSAFNANKKLYQPHKWEKDGKFYNDVFKINKWKDFLPQHIGKDGFSKDHIDDLSIEYIDEFIMETCRGEWNHSLNCAFAIILFLINTIPMAVSFTVIVFIGNVPFIVIQRYNRFRLQKLKKMLLHKKRRKIKLSKSTSSVENINDDNTLKQI